VLVSTEKNMSNVPHGSFFCFSDMCDVWKLVLDPRVVEIAENRMKTFKERFAERWEQALQAAEKSKSEATGMCLMSKADNAFTKIPQYNKIEPFRL